VLNTATNNSAENLAAHRGQILGAILPTAVAYGVAEVEPAREPLRVFQSFEPTYMYCNLTILAELRRPVYSRRSRLRRYIPYPSTTV
jgi:hypothetical protein